MNRFILRKHPRGKVTLKSIGTLRSVDTELADNPERDILYSGPKTAESLALALSRRDFGVTTEGRDLHTSELI